MSAPLEGIMENQQVQIVLLETWMGNPKGTKMVVSQIMADRLVKQMKIARPITKQKEKPVAHKMVSESPKNKGFSSLKDTVKQFVDENV